MMAVPVAGTSPCDPVSEARKAQGQWDRHLNGGDPGPAGRRPFMGRKPIAAVPRLARVRTLSDVAATGSVIRGQRVMSGGRPVRGATSAARSLEVERRRPEGA